MDSDFYFLKGNLNGNILVYMNYTYRKTKQIHNRSYWTCRRGCYVSIVLEEEQICSIRNSDQHTHENEVEDIKILTFKYNLRRSVENNPNSLPETLYRAELAKWTMEDRIKLPQYISMRSALYLYRKEVLPKLPNCTSSIQMEGPWAKTCDGDEFIVYNNEDNDNMLILGTQRSLYLLSQCKLILMDGTFRCVPKRPKFKQLYTIHGEINGKIFPLLYCLLPNMKSKTYEKLFCVIKRRAEHQDLQFNPSTFQIDFEIAAITAIKKVFPNATLKGCFFHFSQSIWRKVQSLGLASTYTHNTVVKQWIRKLIALPLIPLQYLDEAWLLLIEDAPNNQNVTLLLDYIVETWLDDLDARFNRKMWNHFETENHRTTNALESWHSRLNSDINRSHPNFWNFITLLKSDQQYNSIKIELALQDKLLSIVKRKVRERNANFNRHKIEISSQQISLDVYMSKVSRLCPSNVR